ATATARAGADCADRGVEDRAGGAARAHRPHGERIRHHDLLVQPV
ncbi:MAG: hypothetical protein AVDCRST_MAG19-2336, partial [uncultured Thermomicrobiales bacterium]